MSANIDALKAAILVEVADIEDAIAQAEATVLADRYCDALAAQSELESGGIQSYTIAGRQVTRSNLNDGTASINALKAELYRYIRGFISYVNQGGMA